MALEALEKTIRIDIPYFEGVNGAVSYVLAKKTEFAHAENARSKTIGSIEKREGQSVTGQRNNGGTFVTTGNYCLAYFKNNSPYSLYRISDTENPLISVSVYDVCHVNDNTNNYLSIYVADRTTIVDKVFDGAAATAVMYYYSEDTGYWAPLSGNGANLMSSDFDHVAALNCMFLVNKTGNNRYISADGTTVIDSTSGSGHLYNSPPARKVAYYKNRLYLANFRKDFTEYKSTIVRSSYPLGIIALVNEDNTAGGGSQEVKVTDTKYFYADTGTGSEKYEVYRGPNKIADFTVTAVKEYTVTATISYLGSYSSVLSSDEIWVYGTYTGEKTFRWANNPTNSGKDVKLYDTMKLVGGDSDDITMLEPIGDVLAIGNKNTISIWNDYILQAIDTGVGCVSNNGYVKAYGALYFIHYTGIYTTVGGVPTPISQKVHRYIEGATKSGLENAAAGKKGRSVFFQIGSVTLKYPDGSIDKVLNGVVLEYNINQSNWFVHTNVFADEFETYVSNSGYDQLQMTSSVGNKAVKQFLDPNTTTDDGVNIPFRIDIPEITLQKEFENISHPVAIIVDAERGSRMDAYIKLDKDQFYALDGTVRKGVSLLRITNKDKRMSKPPTAYIVSISIRDNSDQICKINRMAIMHIPTLANASNSND